MKGKVLDFFIENLYATIIYLVLVILYIISLFIGWESNYLNKGWIFIIIVALYYVYSCIVYINRK